MRRALVALVAVACAIGDEPGASRSALVNVCIPACNDGKDCTHDVCNALLQCEFPPVADPLCCEDDDDCQPANGCQAASCRQTDPPKAWKSCLSEGTEGEGCCAEPEDCAAPTCHRSSCDDNVCGVPEPTPDAPGCCDGPGDCPAGNLCQTRTCQGFTCGFTAAAMAGCCNVVGDCDPGDACHAVECIENACVTITTCDAGIPDAVPPLPADARVDAPPSPPPPDARVDAPPLPPPPDARVDAPPLPPPPDALVDAAEPPDAAPDVQPDASDLEEMRLRGGGGCSVSDQSLSFSTLALLALALVIVRRSAFVGVRVHVHVRVGVRVGVGVLGFLIVCSAEAQSLDTQLFRPPATSGGVGAVDSADVPPHLAVAASAFFAYTREPLVLEINDEQSNVVRTQFDAQVAASVGLFDRFELGLIAPVLVDQAGGAMPDLAARGVGDVRLEAKARLVEGLALAAGVGLPTGGGDAYYSDATVTFRPRAVVSAAFARVELLGQLGAVLGRRRDAVDLDVGAQLSYGAAARVRADGGLSLFATFTGLVTPGGGAGASPMELLGGPELRVPGVPLELSLAAGRGLNDGYGAPMLRVMFAARWLPRPAPAPRVIATPAPPPPSAPPEVVERDVEVLADVAPREPEPVDPGAELAVVTENAIVIKQEVFFESDKAAIQPRSFRLLATVANLLELHPEITLLRIEGHTDDRGGRGRNLALSQRRAEAVRDHLITVHRIVAVRLMAQGFGPDRPVASNKTTAGRARNRRSEFIIVERKPR